jgi:hypothetical protein
VAPN